MALLLTYLYMVENPLCQPTQCYRLLLYYPKTSKPYAQNLITRLSKAREYMTAITRELRQKQEQYYDIGRKTTVFNVGDFAVLRRPPRSGQTGILAKWLPR